MIKLSPVQSTGLVGPKTQGLKGSGGRAFFDLILRSASTSGEEGSKEVGRWRGPAKGILARLRAALEDTGLPITNFFLPEKDLPLLKNLLGESGFTSEEIEKIISEVPVKQGRFNLGEFLVFLERNPESNVEDSGEPAIGFPGLPLLGKILFDLGLTAGEVKRFNEQISVKEGAISIRDLEKVVRRQFKENLGPKVMGGAEIDEVKELLLKAGFSSEKIDNLLRDLGLGSSKVGWQDFVDLLKRAWEGPQVEENSHSPSRTQVMVEGLLHKVMVGKEGLDPGNSASKALSRTASENTLPDLIKTASLEKWAENWAFEDMENPKTRYGRGDRQLDIGTSSLPKIISDSHPNPPLPVEKRDLLPQIIQPITKNMILLIRNGEDKIKIKLSPPHLGELEIDLALKGPELKATFTTHNFLVKNLLESNIGTLKQVFLDQGINLREFQVLVSYQLDPFRRESGEWSRPRPKEVWKKEDLEQLTPNVEAISPTAKWSEEFYTIDLLI